MNRMKEMLILEEEKGNIPEELMEKAVQASTVLGFRLLFLDNNKNKTIHKVEVRNLNEKYETQINELHNEYKAEIRKLSSRVEILAKEKDLQKEKYESQIADLDTTIRGLGSKKSESQNGDATISEEKSKK